MKKIIVFLVLIIVIPSFIVLNFYDVSLEHLFFIKNENIRVLRSNTNKIEVIPLEEYIVGVLAGEMPINFDEEALKAQALASRSYAYKKMLYNKNKDYDVVDTVVNQVYLDNETLKKSWKDNYDKNINKLKQIVFDTKGQYITYKDKVIDAFFFSTSIGHTFNSEDVFGNSVPYLKSVESKDDISPLYLIEKEYTKEQFYKNLSLTYSDKLNIKNIDVSSSGKINKISINGKIFDSKKIIDIFKLKSSYYKIEEKNNKIVITTRGSGHGVGMSQYGALSLAQKGYDYISILKYYYTGVEIKKI